MKIGSRLKTLKKQPADRSNRPKAVKAQGTLAML
jgi:hypothetical protein